MSRVYFEEVQRFRDNAWVWMLVIGTSLAALIPLIYGIYWQIVKGEPWGNEPLSDRGLIFLFLFVLACLALMIFILLSLKLELRIDEQGIHYRFVPVKNKWQLITKEEIAEYHLEKRFRLLDTAGFGHHRNRLSRTRSFRIRGGNHLSLKFRNGQKLLLGTQNLSEIEWAMKRLMTINEMI